MSADQLQGRGARGERREPVARATRDPRPSTPTSVYLRLLVAVAALPMLTACDWFTEFKNQPRIEPWESPSQRDGDTTHAPRGAPPLSVPITGTAVAQFQVSLSPLPGTIDSMSSLANPTPVSDVSLANGRREYQINCAVCHGDAGDGKGNATNAQVYKNGVMPQISLLTGVTQGRTDGYIFGMIRNGRGLMPSYNRIEELERWDVVNYVRALQGRVPNTAGTGAVGWPGQNGATVPGPSASAPTRPAPHWRPAPAAGAAATPSVQQQTAPEGASPASPAPGATPAAGVESTTTKRGNP